MSARVWRRGIEGVATPLVAGGGIGREIFSVTRAARTPAVEAVLAALG